MKMPGRAVILLCVASCQAVPPGGDLGNTELGLRLADILAGEGCDTSPVIGLSLQIAGEMACMADAVLVPFSFHEMLVAASPAVLPYLSPEAAVALGAASLEQKITLTSAFRTVGQQLLIYHWFQRGLCGFTAAAEPGNSNHETGRAIDVANPDAAEAVLEAHGFKRTVPGDPVHFDHVSSPDLRGLDVHAFQRLWNRNHPDDAIAEDGDYGSETEVRLLLTPSEGFAAGPCDPP